MNKINTIKSVFGIFLILIGLSFVSSATYTDTTSTQFQLTVDYPICSDDGTYFTDYRTTPSIIIPTIGLSPPANCYNPLGESCCPIGSNCKKINKNDPNGVPFYNCFASEIKYCKDYTSQGDCNNYVKWVAEKSIEGLKNNDKFCNNYILKDEYQKNGKSCWDYIAGCQCYWNSVNNSCQPKFSNRTQCEDDEKPSAPLYCEYTITDWIDNCATTGFIDAVWTAEYNGVPSASGECIGGNRQIPCEEITQLGFFNWINFVL
ncbi:MAG: hypothetical protein AABW67_01340, partial [Nanoarchaeota archaeon]